MIDWNFSPARLAILFGVVGVFWFFGGLDYPIPSESSSFQEARVSRTWIRLVLQFVAGAVCVSVVDHWVGNVERSNIRPVYIGLGTILMGASLLWLNSLRVSVS